MAADSMLLEDPFGDDEDQPQHAPGYSIEFGRGDDDDHSEEAQGRRAARHLRRIQQAERLKATKRGVLKDTVEYLEAELARNKRKLSDLDEWTRGLCAVDRMFLYTWLATAKQFHEPDRPRKKTLELADGLVVETKLETKAAQIVLANEAQLAEACPQFVTFEPKLRWGEAKKHLRVVPGVGVVDENGEVVLGVYSQPAMSVERFAVLVDGKRIPLEQGESTDGDSNDGTDGAGEAGAGGDADPFGDNDA